ncbi:MAG: TIM barrel protein [Anaerolineae bacterium]
MKIAVSSWSVRHYINREFAFDQFPTVVRQRFGVDALELVSRHMPAPDMRHIDLFNAALRDNDVRVVNVPIDVGNISDRDPQRRAHDLRAIKTWIDVAAELGSPNARINTGQQPQPYDLSITIDSYRELAEYASARGMRILLENHGGISADPANIITLGEAVGWDRFATCPDFGNFAPELRYEALALVAPHAALAHAKALDLDADGNMPEWDFARCMQIMRDSGFDGYYSAEFEGQGEQYAGTAANVAAIRRALA